MSSATAQSLYSRDVLRLAMALPHDERLAVPQGSATCRSPLCGSEMSADVTIDAAKISAIAFRARACALGQASAAVLRERAKGLSLADITAARDNLASVLNGESSPEWPEMEMLAYARDYPARHGAILLPFETLITAIKQAQS